MQHAYDNAEQLVRKLLGAATDEQCALLGAYIELVAQYSKVLNLTGFGRDRERLVTELVGEAVRLHGLGPVEPGGRVIDLGSGNGSPVVPMAILCPGAVFTAVESRERRAIFLETVKVRLGLKNLTVRQARAEGVAAEWPHHFDLVTSRAFAPPAKLLPLAIKLAAPGGEVRGFLGADSAELLEATAALGLKVVDLISYDAIASPRQIYRIAIKGGKNT